MSSISVGARTLGDVIPGGLVRSIALVLGGTALVALSAQVVIPLPFTPVPLTLQTFAVLLVGAALGSRRGTASMLLYALVGALGVPWFANDNSGWSFATFGYVLGFVVAASLVGILAEHGADRTFARATGLMVLGNIVIYLFGVVGLIVLADNTLLSAVSEGVLPFLALDAVKILIAAGLLPSAWKLARTRP